MSGNFDWNERTIARLRVLWAEGHSTAEIGRRLGVSKHAVVGKAHRLDLPARRSPIRRNGSPSQPAPRRRAPRATLSPLASIQLVDKPVVAAVPVKRESPPLVVVHSSRTCCWPLWGSEKPTHIYCAAPSQVNASYCPMHQAKAFSRMHERVEAMSA